MNYDLFNVSNGIFLHSSEFVRNKYLFKRNTFILVKTKYILKLRITDLKMKTRKTFSHINITQRKTKTIIFRMCVNFELYN